MAPLLSNTLLPASLSMLDIPSDNTVSEYETDVKQLVQALSPLIRKSPKQIESLLSYSPRNNDTHTAANAPILLVHGFFGEGQDYYWWNGMKHHHNVIVSDIGPISSQHDRVCELFYQMVGGTVDYGEEHSQKCGHARYGRTFETPAYAEWSSENPVHTVGYSFGGNTARALQQYLHEQRFPGYDTAADWIFSLTAIAAPLNGSSIVHDLAGLSTSESNSFRALAPGKLLERAFRLYDWMDISLLRNNFYNPYFAHFGKTGRTEADTWSEWLSMLVASVWNTPMENSYDHGLYDMAPGKCSRMNDKMVDAFDCTYYFSFTKTLTKESSWNGIHMPTTATLLSPVGAFLGMHNYDAKSLQTMYPRLDVSTEEKVSAINNGLRRNDCVVPTVLQSHPGLCFTHADQSVEASNYLNGLVGGHEDGTAKCACEHKATLQEHGDDLQTGKWYVTDYNNMDHGTLVMTVFDLSIQKEFFKSLYFKLRTLPMASEDKL
ncbi:hypothetical protein SARC_04021 [Sphaeroforma arctica JP610]|uniref:Lipase-like C-terminal domain-containing protein n=1 Tax=Sphaeroforma arctica JP610 TaxID=667725 RepID=A0A0L0G4D1_9EUKA|nr:hypothetical protein SARC_04021 [Sphaeroforma arctica JP610]KNC83744.1 hypothetical protein SARC_04021 [Sphaeroforma arctica JP610]|eukprot:XP_014157646.1 hypothetical protein SARC_04021 [Sphaeroforma arctica JP610]